MRSLFRKILCSLGYSLLVALLVFVAVALWPASPLPLPAPGVSPAGYEAARARVAQLLADPPPNVRPECRSTVLDHGQITPTAYVLLHGLTNCPAQFRAFAEMLYARGDNVLMLRLPHHGLLDRMTEDSAQLTARDLIDSAGLAVDLAHGYGRRVVVIGLSVSGVSAAWLAQERGDVDLAVVIAPFLAPGGLPAWAISPLANLLNRSPNAFVWWDPRAKENLPGSPFSYPRFATRNIGETMRLGLDVFARARTAPPRARHILLITSPADVAINQARVRELAALWAVGVTSSTFPAGWNVPHDCIDPAQPGGQTALVYPRLIEWMDAELK